MIGITKFYNNDFTVRSRAYKTQCSWEGCDREIEIEYPSCTMVRAIKQFRRSGWSVDKNRHTRCPAHRSKRSC